MMARHVSQRPAAEIPPASPVEGNIIGMVRPIRSRPEPKIVVQPSRDRRSCCGPVAAAPGLPTPHMHLANGTNRAALDQFHNPAVIATGVDLRAHLGDALLLGGGLGHYARFVNTMGQRLFA